MVATFKVYKKSSPDGNIILYIGKRDVVDHITSVDPIDGVIVVQSAAKRSMVVGQVTATFRYGREEDETMGLKFSRDLCLVSEKIFPSSLSFKPTKLQDRLLKKIGGNAYPFRFELPLNAPQSVMIQPGSDQRGEPCGVHYEVKAFITERLEDIGDKMSTVRLGIRKIQWTPVTSENQPCSIIRKDFLLSPGEMELEVTLDKQVYHHTEDIAVNVAVRNYSNKTVKRIRVSVVQNIDICMFASGHCKASISSMDTEDGCPINPGASMQKVFSLSPKFYSHRRGVALDGPLKNEDTKLASSTLFQDNDQKETFGIIISYSVKVKLILGALGGEVFTELPFILMHPRPEKVQIQTDKEDKELLIENFKSSRDNTLDLDEGEMEHLPIDLNKMKLTSMA